VVSSKLKLWLERAAPPRGGTLRYFCLTCDFDGTIAHDGKVAPSTLEGLRRVRESGRKLILATGRELPELLTVFPETSIFDRVVAENGGLLYRPATQEKRALAPSPSAEFVKALHDRGIAPLSVGETIVATWHPHETAVLDVIRDLGLELQIIFNKDAVMILPSSVNKETGLRAALEELGLSPHNVVGVGDAENDHAFLGICECSVAVANAVPALKERADFVTAASHGAGVEQLIDKLLSTGLADLEPRLVRHQPVLGTVEHAAGKIDGTNKNTREFRLAPYGSRLLVAGPSGAGKSTFITALVERLIEKQYQICVIDPEGDYEELEGFVTLGSSDHVPTDSEILEVLGAHQRNLSINLLAIKVADRPAFFHRLLSSIQDMQSKSGRPHWLVIDEAHHLVPSSLDPAHVTVPKEVASIALVTVHPDHVSNIILKSLNGIVALGQEPRSVIAQFNQGAGSSLPLDVPQLAPLVTGEILFWPLSGASTPVRVKVHAAKSERRRHRRKYAAGELGEDKSFYFRGQHGKLNLRAQNMNTFIQLAGGVDDETWTHHLTLGDYSRWLREAVKDPAIADEVSAIERQSLPPTESRKRIVEALRRHYTAPA
jgi:HAD superfamily hydrolase (TIGR01484 family)